MVVAVTNLKCNFCKKKFNIQTRYVKYQSKLNPQVKFYCSKTCRIDATKSIIKINCANCSKEIIKYPNELKQSKTGNLFCTQSCSAKFSNKNRVKINSTKKVHCKHCDKKLEVHVQASAQNVVCIDCKSISRISKRRGGLRIYKSKSCLTCSTIISHGGKYCDPCRHLRHSEVGKKSAETQSKVRRSKNEIYFADLCKTVFTEVLENKSIFNGWDADVILPELNLAVLWNGNWHHKQITKKHSLKQVQARDKIKIDQIRLAGYRPYVINDYGSHDTEFVEIKFQELIDGYILKK